MANSAKKRTGRHGLAAAVIACAISGAVPGMPGFVGPASAALPPSVPNALPLTPTQATAVQNAVQTAVNSVNRQTFATPQDKENAMIAALKTVILSSVQSYGGNYAGGITSVYLEAVFGDGLSPKIIGRAPCEASATLSPADMTAASAIALDVANESNAEVVKECLTALQDEPWLARIASGDPEAIGDIGEPNPPLSNPPQDPAPVCTNPSCS